MHVRARGGTGRADGGRRGGKSTAGAQSRGRRASFWHRQVREHWALIVADFRREYHLTPTEIGELTVHEFAWYLRGLSEQSVWRITVSNEPATVTGADAQRVLNMM